MSNVEKLSNACVRVLNEHYGVSITSEMLLEGMDNVRSLTQFFLKTVSESCRELRLSDEEILLYSEASMFHDVGKFLIDKDILNKPGRLTDEEFAVIKTHPTLGLEILNKVSDCDKAFLDAAKNAAYFHHERWDGSGYPNGLRGEEIPFEAHAVAMADVYDTLQCQRIYSNTGVSLLIQAISLADVYDALRSDRPYKKAMSHEDAVQLIKTGKCGAFNPLLLDCLDERDCFALADTVRIVKKPSLDIVIKKAEKHKDNNFSKRELLNKEKGNLVL